MFKLWKKKLKNLKNKYPAMTNKLKTPNKNSLNLSFRLNM